MTQAQHLQCCARNQRWQKRMARIIRAQGHSYTGEQVDLACVIDVIRAFTTEKVFFERGANSVTLVETVDELFRMQPMYPDFLTVAEKHGLPVKGADLCNSPSRALNAAVDGQDLLHATTNGTKATHAVLPYAGQIIVTGLSNAKATLDYIKQQITLGEASSILIMSSHPTGDDDEACADYLEAGINDCEVNNEAIIKRVFNASASEKFLDAQQPDFPPEDVDHYSQIGDSDFVMKADLSGELPVISKLVFRQTEY